MRLAIKSSKDTAEFSQKLREKIRLKNTEVDTEKEVEGVESQKKLSCHIDNENNPISYLQDGIKLSLTGALTKRSEIAGRDCLYTKTMQISKLVLIMNFIRVLSNALFCYDNL